MGCPDQLAVKQDFLDQDGRLLSQLATKQQADEILFRLRRVEVGTDTTIPGAIANIVESLASIIRDPIVAVIEGTTDAINNTIDAIENSIIAAIKSSENAVIAGINATESVLNNTIDAIENSIIAAIKSSENVVTSAFDSGINALERFMSGAINGVVSIINNGIDALESSIAAAVAIVDDVKTIATEIAATLRAGFDTMNNLINSTRELILAALATSERLWTKVLNIVEALAPNLQSIISEAREFLALLIGEHFSTLRALIEGISEAFPDFNFDGADILGAIQAVDRKLGSYPLACGDNPPITGTNTVAGALEAIICGSGAAGGSSPSDETDLSNLSNRRLLEKMADAIGVSEFPGQVPKTLLNSGDNPERSGVEQIPNLVQFILWIVKQMDALIGEFPVKIKIKDSDLVQEGNQEVDFEVQNIAEALADIYGHGASSLILQNAQTNMMLRLAAETVSIKTATLINQDLAIANQDFLGYQTKRKKREAQSAFNIAKINPNNIKSLSQILRSESFKYQGFEFSDKAVLMEYLPRFMFAASIVKSALYRTDDSAIDSLQELADESLDDADNGWENFVDEVNNPDSFFNRDEPDRPFIRDFNDEDRE